MDVSSACDADIWSSDCRSCRHQDVCSCAGCTAIFPTLCCSLYASTSATLAA
jgi:hypothetical protein